MADKLDAAAPVWQPVQRYCFTPESLTRHFGAESEVARSGITSLCAAIASADSDRSEILFGKWQALFSGICGHNLEDKRKKISELGAHYGLDGARPAELLFSIHTYFAIFMKFLASEIVSCQPRPGASLLKRCAASTPDALLREVRLLEHDAFWSDCGITNFLDDDLFSWYLSVWDDKIAAGVQEIARKLCEYDPATLSPDIGESRDLLKSLYQNLFPNTVRHDLGEYYTPDWLAEHVLEETGYGGDPDARLLDPACGSGTFVIMAINRVRRWFEGHRERCGYGEAELVKRILRNVIGCDLNPLAILAARTNYLLATRGLLHLAGRVELPVYLRDAVMMEADDGNPLSSPVDYVVGNPPWVNWENLPSDYRARTKPLWHSYGLFSLSGSAGRLGGGKKDISMLFVYVCADRYLSDDGRLGFVITQTVFKTKGAGAGFRTFRLSAGEGEAYIRPLVVHDLSRIQVFEGATNRAAVLICQKVRKQFEYPVRYVLWRGPCRIRQEASLDEVRACTRRLQMGAIPSDFGDIVSPWLSAPRKVMPAIRKMTGHGDYTAYTGVLTGGLNGCFWIRVLERMGEGSLLVANLHDAGRIKVPPVQTTVESDLVYPLIRGRDISRWRAEPSAHVILAQDPETRHGIPEAVMKRVYPRTYAYLLRFKKQLQKRASRSIRRLMATGAFYSMYAVGPHTMSRWKVIWAGQVAASLNACVISSSADLKPILPDQTAYLVPFSSSAEAMFFCAILNSLPVRAYYAFLAYKHTSMNFIKNLSIPRYDPLDADHVSLAELAHKCHLAAKGGQRREVADLECKIDEMTGTLWNISLQQLGAIRDALVDVSGHQ